VPERRHAPDREPGGGPGEVGVRADHRRAELLLQPRLVGAVRAGHQRQHRLVAAAEHQRLHDRADLRPDRRGGLGRGPRGVGQLTRLDLHATGAQRALETIDGAQGVVGSTN
jgi:hypothetical protein